MKLSRREIVKLGAGAGAYMMLGCKPGAPQPEGPTQKPIPSSGERIPVIGIGTARNRFSVDADPAEIAMRKQVLREFGEMGGRVLDTAPSYGTAEVLCGNLIQELGNRDKIFIATKVNVGRAVRSGSDPRQAGMDQMNESFSRFYDEVIDLMQIHNLADWENQLPILREWKQEGRFRYIGMTTSSSRQYERFEQMMRREELDFVQIDYSLVGRLAEERLLPLAADRGMAVLINLPFRRGRVFQRLGDRPLPDWAAELNCKTMAQVTLKFIVSHPSVTCAIPGTYKMDYLLDNMGAARGPLPDAAMRKTMADWYDALPEG
jgi:aryl-alcohol dehydrogenase-like predicted oxidoreductase